MATVAENYTDNYNAITASTKGSAPSSHVMWSAVLLTIFEMVENWMKPEAPKRMTKK